MQLTFNTNKNADLSFKMGIAGTSAAPQSVSVVLEKDSIALSYPATRNGDEWRASIQNPGNTFGTGEVNLNITVLLNNKLFTPVKTKACIIEDSTIENNETIPNAHDKEVHVTQSASVEPEEMQATEIDNTEIQVTYHEDIKLQEDTIIKANNSTQDLLTTIRNESNKEISIEPIKLQLLKSIELVKESIAEKQPIAEKQISKAPKVKEDKKIHFTMSKKHIIYK